METYEHEFDRIEDYLHHRPPYLMVDRIVSVSENEIVTERRITGEEFFIGGHFPGAPIVPGAMMQEMSTQSAGVLIAAKHNPMQAFNTSDPTFNEYALGVLVRVKHARNKGFARPGDVLQATVRLTDQLDNLFDFSATIRINDTIIMRNAFQLTNIKSSILIGQSEPAV